MKKLFSVLTFAFFITSFMNASGKMASAETHNYDHCYHQAEIMEFSAIYFGFSANEAYEMGSNSFDRCVDKANIEAAIYWRYN